MTKKIIDLSVALETGIISDPPMALPKIEYIDHTNSAEQYVHSFQGLPRMICLEVRDGQLSNYL